MYIVMSKMMKKVKFYWYISLVMSYKPYHVKYQYLQYIVIPKLWYRDTHTWGGMASGVATLGPTGALAPPSAYVAPPSIF